MRERRLSPMGILVSFGDEWCGSAAESFARLPPRDMERLADYGLGPEHDYLAWEVVRCVDELSSDEMGLLHAVVLGTLASQMAGNTYLPVGGAQAHYGRKLIEHLLAKEVWESAVALLSDPRCASIIGRPGDYKPLILDGDMLYHHRLFVFEERLAALLGRRCQRGESGRVLSEMERLAPPLEGVLTCLRKHPIRVGDRTLVLSNEQEETIRHVVMFPLTIVTGGPGTGKTWTIVAILRTLVRLGWGPSDIALAAPTGKASARIKQAIEEGLESIVNPEPEDRSLKGILNPQTLHRLLGASLSGNRFRHHKGNPLSEKIVIVDECSMVDLGLMYRLCCALKEESKLVLVGDAEQLPSVEAGSVFRDLVEVSGSLTVRLTSSYRMDPSDPAGRRILMVAGRINRGEESDLMAGPNTEPKEDTISVRQSVEELTFEGVEMLEGVSSEIGRQNSLHLFLDTWLKQRVLALENIENHIRRAYVLRPDGFSEEDRLFLERLFSHFENHKILCVTKGAERVTGAEWINSYLSRSFLKIFFKNDEGAQRADFLVGTPVLVLENDYERNLFNGDQGLVLWVCEEGDPKERPPMAVFRRGSGQFAAFDLWTLRGRIQQAFAITVHKGQGTEFTYVGLVLPDKWIPLVERALLYTAITRARKSAVIFGPQEVFLEGIRHPTERFCGLGKRVKKFLDPVLMEGEGT